MPGGIAIAQRLPQEVLTLIFSYIEQDDDDPHAPSNARLDAPTLLVRSREHQQYLISLLLVCQAWQPVAMQALCRRLQVTIKSGPVQAVSFFQNTPSLALHILSLYIYVQTPGPCDGPAASIGALLSLLPNIQTYLLEIDEGFSPVHPLLLPTNKNSRLTFLGLGTYGRPVLREGSLDYATALQDLPHSIKRLEVSESILPDHAKFSLPNLTTLCTSESFLLSSKCPDFKACYSVESLVVNDSIEDPAYLRQLLDDSGHQIKYLQLPLGGDQGPTMNQSFAAALPKLEHLEMYAAPPCGVEADSASMPKSLRYLTMHDFEPEDWAFEILQKLRNPAFIPNLAAFPEIYDCERNPGEYPDWSLWQNELDEASVALTQRGLHPDKQARKRRYPSASWPTTQVFPRPIDMYNML